MIIAALDLETTGLDAKKDEITEIGVVLFDTETKTPIAFFNKLLKVSCKLTLEIVKLTGITNELLEKYGEEPQSVYQELEKFIEKADFLMAHNSPFDEGFLKARDVALNRKWIDSSVDVEYPEEIKTRKLTHLACEHGFVNPFAHRSVTDVLTMIQVVNKYDWNEVIQNALTPNITIRAMVTFQQNQKAKDNGFRWDGTNKIWSKQIKQTKLISEVMRADENGYGIKEVK